MVRQFLHSKRILVGILFFAFLFRLHGFANPIADWHSWRQADTSAVSRNFVKQGYDILHPRFDDLSNVPSGKDNPNGYRFVEFPIYNLHQAIFYQLFPIFTIEEWGRLVTIFSALLTIIFIYLLTTKYVSKTAGICAAFFYAFLPYNIYYGRVILPDPMMVMTILGGTYFFDLAIDENFRFTITNFKPSKGLVFYVLAMLFTAAAFLIKPYALFFTLPMLFLVWQKYQFSAIKKWQLWIFAIITLLPLIGWRLWIQQYPEGVPANSWLLNGNGIRFRPAFFRWMGYERLIKLISGYSGILLLILGVIEISKKKIYFIWSFIFASFFYVIIFATGNVQHDYYQILVMPSIAMLFGISAAALIEKKNNKHRILFLITLSIVTGTMFFFSWRLIKDFFNINNPSIVIAGKAVDSLTPPDVKVIANYTGDTSFLYQTNRQGWASFEKPIPEMIGMGARYLVLANPTVADHGLSKDYKVIKETKEYILFDLMQKP